MDVFKEELEKEFSALGFKDKSRVLTKGKYQVGKTHKIADAKRYAMPSGKRRSKAGNIYYEYRKNRTDMNGSV